MIPKNNKIKFFDEGFSINEQIPRQFSLHFLEYGEDRKEVKVIFNEVYQIGDKINDNSYENDFYRYHDVFHYSFATILGWSPCARAMMKRKRKSNEALDRIEDGARAAITEEAISMIVFNEAKRNHYFKNCKKVSKTTLRIIKEMTENFEVKIRSSQEWEKAILKSYDIFRLLLENKGGKVEFDAYKKEINYTFLN